MKFFLIFNLLIITYSAPLAEERLRIANANTSLPISPNMDISTSIAENDKSKTSLSDKAQIAIPDKAIITPPKNDPSIKPPPSTQKPQKNYTPPRPKVKSKTGNVMIFNN